MFTYKKDILNQGRKLLQSSSLIALTVFSYLVTFQQQESYQIWTRAQYIVPQIIRYESTI